MMVKFLVIGDPHGSEKVFDIPINKPDYILIPGDIGKADLMRKYTFENVDKRKSWTETLPKKDVKKALMEAINSSIKVLKYFSKIAPVYIIYGNVEPTNSEIKKLNKKRGIDIPLFEDKIKAIKNVHVINNKIVKLDGVVLAGNEYFVDTGWVRDFTPGDKKRMVNARKDTERAKKFYSKLKKVDILMCHQPPKGYLDKVGNFESLPKNWRGKNAGSSLILSYIKKFQHVIFFFGESRK